MICDKFYKKFADQITQSVNMAVNDFFNLNNWEFGQDLQAVDLVKALANISQISSVSITFTTDVASSVDVVSANFYQIIVPNHVQIQSVYQ